MKNNKLIHDGDFCMITSDKFEEHGVKVGQRVWVAGHRAIPEDERDPYTQRIKFFVHLVKDKHVQTDGIYIMDPKSLKRVNKGEQHKLQEVFNVDFSDPMLQEEYEDTLSNS